MKTNTVRKVIRRMSLMALLFLLVACGYYHEPTPESAAGGNLSGKETLGFEIVKTIFARNRCFSCHSAEKGNVAGINLESFAATFPLSAKVAGAIESGAMPLGGPKAPAADIAVIQAWVAAGAPETSDLSLPGATQNPVETNPPPALAALDFARVKAEIFVPHCVGCHSSFNNYVDVTNRLPAIQRAVDTNLMPKFGPPLSADQKKLLNDWISAGAPEVAGQAPAPVVPPRMDCEDPRHGDDDCDEDPILKTN